MKLFTLSSFLLISSFTLSLNAQQDGLYYKSDIEKLLYTPGNLITSSNLFTADAISTSGLSEIQMSVNRYINEKSGETILAGYILGKKNNNALSEMHRISDSEGYIDIKSIQYALDFIKDFKNKIENGSTPYYQYTYAIPGSNMLLKYTTKNNKKWKLALRLNATDLNSEFLFNIEETQNIFYENLLKMKAYSLSK